VCICSIIVSIIMIPVSVRAVSREERAELRPVCIIYIGVVSVYMQYKCVYYYDTHTHLTPARCPLSPYCYADKGGEGRE
jgi:hypothetical protein